MTNLILHETTTVEDKPKITTFSPKWPFTQAVLHEDINIIYHHTPTEADFVKNIPVFQIYEYQNQYICGVHNFVDDTYVLDRTFLLEDTIGTHTDVTIMGLNNNQPIRGKVDTGAHSCCLNAKNIKVNGGEVTFDLGDSRYTLKTSGTHDIQNAEGSELRPVITVCCKVNDEVIKDVSVNLNDRGDLDDFLIGINLLSKLNCTIDPRLDELVTQCLNHLS
jgi:hypothetical protein